MEKHHKFSIWYVILAVWGVLIIHNLLFTFFAIETIPYSEFLNMVKQGKISEVAITQNQIQGKMADGKDAEKGKLFRTVRVDPEISDLLAQNNITFKGEIESTFFRDLLSWIVPIFLFIGVWLFIMRRMMGQQPGFMSLGKNKAKIYMQEDLKITFDDVAGVDESKQEMEEVIEYLKNPFKFTKIGGMIPRGILLVGPPGTGKSQLIANLVAACVAEGQRVLVVADGKDAEEIG